MKKNKLMLILATTAALLPLGACNSTPKTTPQKESIPAAQTEAQTEPMEKQMPAPNYAYADLGASSAGRAK